MGEVRIVREIDVRDLNVSASSIVDTVRTALIDLAEGRGLNPPKVAIKPQGESLAIAMIAHARTDSVLGMKGYLEFPLQDGRSQTHSTITLFNDQTGCLLAVIAAEWLTAARTGAVSALFAEIATPLDSDTVAIVGAGQQARHTIRAMLHARPNLERIVIFAPRDERVEALFDQEAEAIGTREAVIGRDLRSEIPSAQIVVGAAGPGAHGLVTHDMLSPGATTILVGYGLAADVLHRADRVIA